MQYNRELKNKVISTFNGATKQINGCKSIQISIPSDFEGRSTINSALTRIKAANVEAIKREFERIAAEAEAVEAKALQTASMLEYFGNGANLLEQKIHDKDLSVQQYKSQKMTIEVTNMKGEMYNYVNNNQTDLDNDVKKEIINQIDSINLNDVYKSGIPISEYKNNYMNAINNVYDYVYRQRKDLKRLNDREITSREIDMECQNIKEYLQTIKKTSTHVINGKIYLNIDDNITELTPQIFLEAVKDTQKYIYENSYSHGGNFGYGNSGTPMAGQLQDSYTNRNNGDYYKAKYDNAEESRYVSCDRLIAMSLNRLGLYDDQNVGGVNVIREDYLSTHGFERIEDESDIRPGDIINIKDSSGRWCHTYVIETYDDKTKLCSKFDMGEDWRINSEQAFINVPIVEEPWVQKGKSLMTIYRVKE